MKKVLIILIMPFIYTCGNKNFYTYKSSQYIKSTNYRNVQVDLLIKYPDDYDKKEIATTGFFSYGFETSAVFKNRRAAMNLDETKAIWLSFNPLSNEDNDSLLSIDRNQVIIKGEYHKGLKGHLGIYNGEIEVHYLEVK